MAEPVAFKYRAFISYSHADTSWAKWLHRALESFRIDKDLADRETATGPVPKTLRPIFRDRDEFTAGHALSDQTLAALDASHALIVVCSPASAKSKYVNEEVRLFKSRHPDRPLIPLIVSGKPDDRELECFPPALKFKLGTDGKITDEPVELLAADAREEGDGKSLALAKVVAGLIGVSSDDIFRRAMRERRRRQRNWIAGLATVAVLLAGLAVWAEINRREAVAQRLEAERNFEIAKQGANSLVFDIAQALRYQEGMRTETVRKILGTAESVIGKLVAKSDNNPALLHLETSMLAEFSETYRVQGDTAKQEEAARKELSIAEAGLKAYPDDPNFQDALVTAYTKLGDALKAKGDLAAALELYEKAVALRRSQPEGNQAGPQADIALCDERIGDVLEAQGTLTEALKVYRESFAIRDRLAKAEPGNVERQRALALTYGRLGDVLKAQGKLDEALKAYRGDRDIDERMAKADPGDAGWATWLLYANRSIGNVLVQQGNLAEALKSFQDMLTIALRVAKDDPDNAQRQNDLANAHDSIAYVLKTQGKFDEALNAYRESLAISERLAKAHPDNSTWKQNLAASYSQVGTVLTIQEKFDEAVDYYNLDLAIAEPLAKSDPTNAARQRELSVVYSKIGDVLMQQRKFAEARKNYEAELAIAEHLADLDSSDADKQRELSMAYQRIGFASAMQGDLAGSEKSYRQAFDITERLAKSNPSNAQWQFDLALSYGSLGAVLAAQDKLEDALAAYREQVAVLAPLLKLDASNAAWRKNMDDTASGIGDLAHRLVLAHDFAKALEAANEAIAIMPDAIWLYAAKAPALMATGRTDEARALYLKYRGTAKILRDSSWNDLVLADFAALGKSGFTDPLMDEIEKSFGAETAGTATVAPPRQTSETEAGRLDQTAPSAQSAAQPAQ